MTKTPDMRITIRLEEVLFLSGHSLYSFAIDEVVSWVLGKRFLFLSGFNKLSHINEDVIDFPFTVFFEFGRLRFFGGGFVDWQFSQLKKSTSCSVNL